MGRTPRRDGKITRSKILETAGRLIAEQGYAHTTSKSIAQNAEVDLAAINYHFGGRDGLYRAVLAEGHRRYLDIAELSALAESSMEPRAKLTHFFKRIVGRLIEEQSWHARVLMRELLSPSVQRMDFIQTEVMPKAFYIRRLLHQITGIPEEDPAILRCLMSVMAPCLSLILLSAGGALTDEIRQAVLGVGGTALIEHLTRFSLAGLAAISENQTIKKET